MISTIDIKCNVAHPNMPLSPFYAFKDSPSSIRVLDVPKKIGLWSITSVQIQVTYPDSQVVTKECVRTGNVWVGTLEGTASVGSVSKGYQVTASGIDEDGNQVSGYVLGAGDVVIMELDGSIYPSESADNIRIFDEQPTNPKKGDAYFNDNVLQVYDGRFWKPVYTIDADQYIHWGTNRTWDGNIHRWVGLTGNDKGVEKSVHLGIDSISIDEGLDKHTIITSTSMNTGEVICNSLNMAAGRITCLKDYGVLDIYSSDYRKHLAMDDNGFIVNNVEVPYFYSQYGFGNAKVSDKNGIGYLTVGDVNGYVDIASNKIQLNVQDGNASIKIDGKPVATEEWVENYVRNPSDRKITIKQGGVEKGSFTLNQATDKTIELDAGGGGGDTKCLLYIQHNGNSNQYAQWTAKGADGNNHTYKVTRYAGCICLYKDGSIVAYPNNGGTDILIPVEGNVFVHNDGYSGDSMGLLDNEAVSLNWTSHNTTGHHTMSIIFGDCLEQSTLITMADGTTKAVGELKIGDKVLSLNPDTLQLEEDEVLDCDAGMMKMFNKMDVWNFADGTTINTIKPHQFFNLRTNKMEYIADFQIGDGVRKQDGTTTTLFGHETKLGVFFHNTLYTKKFNNYFANGILTGNRHSAKWGWYWIENNA